MVNAAGWRTRAIVEPKANTLGETLVRPFLTSAILFTCLFSCGCGTVLNLTTPEQRKPYGGVQNDLAVIDYLFNTPSTPNEPHHEHSYELSGWPAAILIATPFVDLALSTVADTLTLPIIRRMERRREATPPMPDRTDVDTGMREW